MQFDLFYQVVKKLKLRRNIVIFGCGTLILFSMITVYLEGITEDSTIITQKMNHTPNSATNFEHLQISNQNNWSNYPEIAHGKGTYTDPYIIDGITFDANFQKYSLIISKTQDYMIFRNCVFNSSYSGESGSLTIDSCSNIDIINCNIINNEQTGLYIKNSQNITVYRTTIEYNSFEGISCSNSSNITFESNTIWANEGIGILIESDSHHIEIFNNEIGYNEIGVKIMGFSTYINVTENYFDENHGNPVILINSSFNSIIGNQLYENGENQILDESDDKTNTIRDNSIAYPLNHVDGPTLILMIIQYGMIVVALISVYLIRRKILKKRAEFRNRVKSSKKIEFCDNCGEKLSEILWNEFQRSSDNIFCEHCGENLL